ncbi:MAG: hypothetical protein J6P46_10280 [Bacteroidales bacterium]|nr:hypothetical protein [Bacteroidales bacterium]
MKKVIISLAAAAMLIPASLFAQETPVTLKPYGFVRSYAFFDSRATKSLAEDMFFFIPLDENKVGDSDVNNVPSFNYQAISTRLGLDLTGYQFGGTKINGKIEADFYCLNSGGNVGTLRMRQAWIDLIWNGRGSNGTTDLSLRIGQGWHPLAADLAHTVAMETGAPFSPFHRGAQLLFNATFDKKVTLTLGLLQQMQYRSSGPDGGSNKYQRHAMPEVYAGVSYSNEGFLGRLGVSVLNIRPRYGYNAAGQKYNEMLTTVNPFAFIQYTDGMFQLRAKTVLAQAGEHMQLNSGYAVSGVKDDGFSREYTPIRSSVSFVSVQYGKTWQFIGMLGYHKNLGTVKDITGAVYFSGNGFRNINQMARFSPTLAYNLGKMQFSLEYDLTGVEYGDLDVRSRVTENLHWVANHRLTAMAKFSF